MRRFKLLNSASRYTFYAPDLDVVFGNKETEVVWPGKVSKSSDAKLGLGVLAVFPEVLLHQISCLRAVWLGRLVCNREARLGGGGAGMFDFKGSPESRRYRVVAVPEC